MFPGRYAMARALWLKIGAILAIALALLVPIKLIEGKIEERQATRASVVRELAGTSVGEQTIGGPLLVFPCTEHYEVDENDPVTGPAKVKRSRNCTRSYVPETLAVTGTAATENR